MTPTDNLEAGAGDLVERLGEAQADAYRSSLLAVARLGDLDKANERANKNWRDFRDLRLEIIGDGPMCRDCADENGRCPHSGQPCDPDEAVKEQLASWRSLAAQLAAVTAENARLRERIEQAYKAGFDFAMLTNSADADLAAENARLREALEPFAALAGSVFRAYEDGREMNASKADDDTVWGFDRVDLTYGALRRARAVLSQEAPK